MFERFWQSRSRQHHCSSDDHEGFDDGQLSEIDVSSAGTSASASSLAEMEEEISSLSSNALAATVEETAAAEKPKTMVDLLRREFGPRGTLFSVTSQDYLNERRQKRLVSKKGQVQIARIKVDDRRRRYLTDIFSTMLDLKWRYVLFIFTASFFLSWLAFAVIWWVILCYRGDFEPGHLPPEQEANDWQPCKYMTGSAGGC